MIGWNGVSEEFESNLTFEKDRLVVVSLNQKELLNGLRLTYRLGRSLGHRTIQGAVYKLEDTTYKRPSR